MTTIAALADIHISARPGGRLSECQRILEWILDDAARANVAATVVAGDVYHSGSRPDERLVARWFCREATRTAPLVVVAGNHDVERDLAILDSFGTAHPVTVVEQPGVIDVAGVRLACLPHLRRADLLRRVQARGGTPTTAALREEMRAILDDLGAAIVGTDAARILVGHAMVAGARLSNDQPAQGRGDLDVTNDDLARAAADAYLLGHVHAAQDWLIGGRPACYPGAPYATTYGELGPKGYVLVHVDGRRVSFERRIAPATPLVLLVGNWVAGAGLVLSYGREHAAGDATPTLASCRGADVRLRYTTTDANRACIVAAAESARDDILAAGAVAVKLEPVPQRVTRARAAGIDKVPSVHDRLDAYWTAIGRRPARRERVLAMLDEMVATSPEDAGGLVRFERVACRGLGPFVGEAEYLVRDMPPIVALAGGNGAGKSTLLGLMLAALREESPTHGAFDRMVTGPNPYLEVEVVTATGAWTIHHEMTDGGGTVRVCPLGEDAATFVGGRQAFREWARQHLPDPVLLLAFAFLWDGSDGIGTLYDSGLKAALLGILGAGNYEAWAAAARAARAAIDKDVAAKRTESTAIGPVDVTGAERAVVDATAASHTADCAAAQARVDAARWTQWRALCTTADAAAVRVERLTTELAAARQAADCAAPPPEHIEEVVEALDVLRQRESVLRADVSTADEAIRSSRDAEHEAARALADIDHRLDALRAERTQAEGAERLRESLPELEASERAAAAALEAATHVAQTGRVTPLRTALTDIGRIAASAIVAASPDVASSSVAEVRRRSRRAIAADDAYTHPNIVDLTSRAASAAARLAAARERLARAPTRLVADIDAAIATAERTRGGIAARLVTIANELAPLRAARAAALRSIDEVATERHSLEARHRALVAAQTRSTQAIRAAERVALLDDQLADATARHTDASAVLQAFGDEPAPVGQADVEHAARGASVAATRLALAVDRLARERDAAARAARVREATEELERRAEDAGELAQALGRDGVQALEMELAGEEIAEIATDLLRAADGAGWSIEYRGTRTAARGKRSIEQARWIAISHPDQREREVRACSKGERALLSTALALATAGVVIERWGAVPGATLAFDETSGPLRGPCVEAWFSMLRAAVRELGLGTVLLVPPDSPPTLAMVDAVVMVPA